MLTFIRLAVILAADSTAFEGEAKNREKTPAHKAIQYREKTDYYDFKAKNLERIRKKIKKLGPQKGHQHFGASMKHKITWVLDYMPSSGGCHVRDVSLILDVKFIMPRWRDKKKAPQSLQKQWDIYYKKLKEHEDIHALLASQTAQQIKNTLLSLKKAKTCSQLEKKAHHSVKKLLAKGEKLQHLYDRITQHGQTQERYKNELKF